jgi:hypothetical protein
VKLSGDSILNILGKDKEEKLLDTAIDNRDAAIALAEQARFSLNLFTRDLDPRVFDNAEFERCLFKLARMHKNADIRMLVYDSSIAVNRGHCLIRLAQKLTSSVHIHNPAKEYSGELSTFMIADNVGLLHRPRSTSNNYDAVVNFMSPQRAGELNDYFNLMWEKSAPDSQIRRLYI